jgi:hypothetical protein
MTVLSMCKQEVAGLTCCCGFSQAGCVADTCALMGLHRRMRRLSLACGKGGGYPPSFLFVGVALL